MANAFSSDCGAILTFVGTTFVLAFSYNKKTATFINTDVSSGEEFRLCVLMCYKWLSPCSPCLFTYFNKTQLTLHKNKKGQETVLTSGN